MESELEARDAIFREVTIDDPAVRADFINHFGSDANIFAASLAKGVVVWRQLLDKGVAEQERAYISGLVHASLGLQILSMKLLLSGQMIAAGNMFRQVLEASSVALLCSSKSHSVLKQFMEGRYDAGKAVRQVLRDWKKLGLLEDAVPPLKESETFYHLYSHVTQLTLANFISFGDPEPQSYVGASFDPGKMDAYKKEVTGRLGFAAVFPGLVHAIRANMDKW